MNLSIEMITTKSIINKNVKSCFPRLNKVTVEVTRVGVGRKVTAWSVIEGSYKHSSLNHPPKADFQENLLRSIDELIFCPRSYFYYFLSGCVIVSASNMDCCNRSIPVTDAFVFTWSLEWLYGGGSWVRALDIC